MIYQAFRSPAQSNMSESACTKLPGRCDICNQRDHFNEHNLQKCVECGVLVHETCNGMPSTPNHGKLENWTCLACRSVGQTFKGRQQLGHQSDNCWDDCEVKQEERPTACALCSVRSGCHAMHPLYDLPGSQGRQVVNKSGKLVWVHTLCGMYHAMHTKMVYGCDKYGNYYDDSNLEEETKAKAKETEEDDTDTKKVEANNSIIGSKVIEFEFASPPPGIVDEPSDVESKPSLEEDEEVVSVTATAWFVIGGKETGRDADWARQTRTNIINARKDVCCFCKHPDNVSGCLRVPVSCSAGSSDEPKALSRRRKNANDRCATAMHVGCARWALNQKGKHAGKNPNIVGCFTPLARRLDPPIFRMKWMVILIPFKKIRPSPSLHVIVSSMPRKSMKKSIVSSDCKKGNANLLVCKRTRKVARRKRRGIIRAMTRVVVMRLRVTRVVVKFLLRMR